jgi:hypothetical protein
VRILGPAAGGLVACFALLAWFAACAPARADVQTFDGLQAPVIHVNLRSGDLTIRTWDRQAVQVDGDPSLKIVRRINTVPVNQEPTLIPPAETPGQDGPVNLPAESFVTSLAPGPHDVINVRGEEAAGTGPVTVTVPSDAALVLARTVNGNLEVHNYRAGTLLGFVRNGRIALDNVGGTVFVQNLRGPVLVNDSDVSRIRARTALGNLVFERCNVKQVEATSVNGSIVYDGGSFAPGLARFDSTHGNVAIGANGPVQMGGHAASGRVYTLFDNRAQIDRGDGAAHAAVGTGGPVITATSGSGNVYLYDGSLRSRQRVPPEWNAPDQTLRGPAAPARHAPRARRAPRVQ